MNSYVHRNIMGHRVSARPIYKGGTLPVYWMGILDDRALHKTFATPSELFEFVRDKLGQDLF